MSNKITGSYYTPKNLVSQMVKFISNKKCGNHILEPSAGDGRFIGELLKLKKFNIDSVELIESKAKNIEETYAGQNVNSINLNFLEYAQKCEKRYDLIIGNPPYIDGKILDEKSKSISFELGKEFNLSKSSIRNIWVSFILASIKLLKSKGSMFFVLPSEFLQVDYAKNLRKILESRFNEIEIFVFNKKIFEGIQQNVCLVYMSNISSEISQYIKYNIVEDDLNNINSCSKIMRNMPLEKWSNAIVSDDNIEMLKKIESRCVSISDIGDMSPGVVTGANSYFIKNKEFIKKNKLESYVKKIIPKSSYISNKFILNDEDFNKVSRENKDVYLIYLNNKKKFSKNIKEYISYGEKEGIYSRYKCTTRNPWYNLPKFKQGSLLFYKRYDEIPRLIVNSCDICTTDIAYNIEVSSEYDIESLGFCFYNSLTLLLCEFNGRFYGGGVIELTPNEFRKVKIPYRLIKKEDIQTLDGMIRNRVDINEIIKFVDNIVLKEIATEEEINTINELRLEYIKRRKFK